MTEDQVLETKEGSAPRPSRGMSPWLEFWDTDTTARRVVKRARPLGDRIIVRPMERKKVEMAGLIVAQPKQEEMPVEGVVVSIGPETPEGSIEVGDVVLYGSDDGVSVKLGLDAKEYLVLADEHVVALLDKQSDLLERDRFSRILMVRNNWVLLEWEEATQEFRLAGKSSTLLRPETFKQAHFTGIVKMFGPDASAEVKELHEQRVFFDRWAHDFREKNWYEPGTDGRPRKRYALMLDFRLECVLPERAKVTVEGHEEVPDDGPTAERIEVNVKRDVGRVYG